jgi:hypothetical protein
VIERPTHIVTDDRIPEGTVAVISGLAREVTVINAKDETIGRHLEDNRKAVIVKNIRF